MTPATFDTIIVGAGPAGCVLASRLSDQPSRSILLVDAGPDYGPDPSTWPPEILSPIGPVLETHSWNYTQRPDINERRLSLPRGRVFGGCSSVNSCIWLHGSRADYDHWSALGNPGWDFDHLEPFFRIAERDPLHAAERHGDHLINVWRQSEENLSKIDRALRETADELAIPVERDLNEVHTQRPMIGSTPKNIRDGIRLNAALTYLSVARSRPNLTLMPDTLVDRLVLDGRQAVGVLTAGGVKIDGRRIILCSGAYGSPAILLRSGIGPADHLRNCGITAVIDLPGVGENLMDHPYLAPYTSEHTSFFIGNDAVPGRPVFIETMIKARSRRVHEEIDLHIYPRELPDERGRWVLGFGISLQYARSRGRMRLTSSDPDAPLDIDHRYFSDPEDLEALTDGVELVVRLANTPPLASLLNGPVQPGANDFDREAIKKMIRTEVGTTFHPSSTCKMGPASDPLAVVDNVGRVHGMEGLHVVDASIFPSGPRCNLHAPVVAVADRMATILHSIVPS